MAGRPNRLELGADRSLAFGVRVAVVHRIVVMQIGCHSPGRLCTLVATWPPPPPVAIPAGWSVRVASRALRRLLVPIAAAVPGPGRHPRSGPGAGWWASGAWPGGGALHRGLWLRRWRRDLRGRGRLSE